MPAPPEARCCSNWLAPHFWPIRTWPWLITLAFSEKVRENPQKSHGSSSSSHHFPYEHKFRVNIHDFSIIFPETMAGTAACSQPFSQGALPDQGNIGNFWWSPVMSSVWNWKENYAPVLTLWLCQNSYWKLPFIVDLPIDHGDFL